MIGTPTLLTQLDLPPHAMSLATPPPVQPRPSDWQAVNVRCWMLWDRPLLSLTLTVGVLALAGAVYFVSENMLGTSLAVTAQVIVLRRVWLPIWFRLDAQGIVRQVWGRSRRIPWSSIARYETCRHGAVLFPFGADYRMAAGQGLFIPWADRRDEVLTMLRQFVAIEVGQP